MQLPVLRGRGAADNPQNRFEPLAYEPDAEERASEEYAPDTRLYRDHTKSILARNNSPDVPFDVSVNPYRGCEHGCVYCFARPTHEYLGFSAGLDFESRILVKEEAPALLRKALSAKSWKPQSIALSGNTDPYQPIERKLRITRGILEVLAEFRNPVGIITKNHLVTRDLDLLAELAAHQAAVVNVSVTTLDPELRAVMEPRTATPARRLDAIRAVARAGIPVGVMVAPVIPGLTDHELPAILEAAAEAGATRASWIPVRLPHGVAPLFEQWLADHRPERREKVLNRIREMRGGALNDARFGARMRGQGIFAEQTGALFRATCKRLGLNAERRPLSAAAFRVPVQPGGQLGLFS